MSGFHEELVALRKKYPQYYIEVWGPDDFLQAANGPMPDAVRRRRRGLTRAQIREIVGHLEHNFDANLGTNWDAVNSAVSSTLGD